MKSIFCFHTCACTLKKSKGSLSWSTCLVCYFLTAYCLVCVCLCLCWICCGCNKLVCGSWSLGVASCNWGLSSLIWWLSLVVACNKEKDIWTLNICLHLKSNRMDIFTFNMICHQSNNMWPCHMFVFLPLLLCRSFTCCVYDSFTFWKK